ncbi:acyl-CoA thioesterase [Maribius pontilimi]|uniref:Acyl-CoA thioesterase n=1 Tax=Palleronia pontilimi TaxID=1964209 RepID=A0A934IIX1_9RHOB|nr:thioesterase family protein [Palleronia pontilimi]MBJ3764185.1 acyl-CoA thioesterase [Palleronia pontilimi]
MGTRWFDNDIYGHLNNALHYQLFDTAVNAPLVEAGVLDPVAGETAFLVVESGCRYFAPLAFPQTVTAGLRVAHLGRSSVRYEIGLFADDSDVAAAEGFFVHVSVRRATSEVVPIVPPVRALLEAIQVADASP